MYMTSVAASQKYKLITAGPHLMFHITKPFFLALWAMEFALSGGYGRSLRTG